MMTDENEISIPHVNEVRARVAREQEGKVEAVLRDCARAIRSMGSGLRATIIPPDDTSKDAIDQVRKRLQPQGWTLDAYDSRDGVSLTLRPMTDSDKLLCLSRGANGA